MCIKLIFVIIIKIEIVVEIIIIVWRKPIGIFGTVSMMPGMTVTFFALLARFPIRTIRIAEIKIIEILVYGSHYKYSFCMKSGCRNALPGVSDFSV